VRFLTGQPAAVAPPTWFLLQLGILSLEPRPNRRGFFAVQDKWAKINLLIRIDNSKLRATATAARDRHASVVFENWSADKWEKV
jgi:hypothetical protein